MFATCFMPNWTTSAEGAPPPEGNAFRQGPPQMIES